MPRVGARSTSRVGDVDRGGEVQRVRRTNPGLGERSLDIGGDPRREVLPREDDLRVRGSPAGLSQQQLWRDDVDLGQEFSTDRRLLTDVARGVPDGSVLLPDFESILTRLLPDRVRRHRRCRTPGDGVRLDRADADHRQEKRGDNQQGGATSTSHVNLQRMVHP